MKTRIIKNSINVALTSIRLVLYIAFLPILAPVCILFSFIALLVSFFIWIIEGEDNLDTFDFGVFAAVIPFKKLYEIISDLVFEIRNIRY